MQIRECWDIKFIQSSQFLSTASVLNKTNKQTEMPLPFIASSISSQASSSLMTLQFYQSCVQSQHNQVCLKSLRKLRKYPSEGKVTFTAAGYAGRRNPKALWVGCEVNGCLFATCIVQGRDGIQESALNCLNFYCPRHLSLKK